MEIEGKMKIDVHAVLPLLGSVLGFLCINVKL